MYTSRFTVKYILTRNPLQFILGVKIWNNLFTVLHILSLPWWKLFWFCLLLLTNITVSNAGNYTEPGFDWKLVPKLQWMLVLIPISKWLTAHADDKITYVYLRGPLPSKQTIKFRCLFSVHGYTWPFLLLNLAFKQARKLEICFLSLLTF